MYEKKEKTKSKVIMVVGIISFLLLMAYLSWASANSEGEYDYCVEWEGINQGILRRDNLIYTCFSLSTLEFKCDYEINEQTNVLEIRPIVNTTEEGGILTSITYGDSNYFECKRWLKSKK